MIKSQLLLDILDLALDDEIDTVLLKKQVLYLTEKSYDHTNSGLYIYFEQNSEIRNYKIHPKQITSSNQNGDEFYRLDGVEIKNELQNILADATVHLTNGLIDCIEIWNKIGIYPKHELFQYEIYQTWLPEKTRQIIKRY